MRIRRFPAAEFLAAAGPFLAEREALHNLPASVARHVVADPARYPLENDFLLAEDGGGIVGIALRTPPHRLQCYVPEGEALEALVEHFAARGADLPGVHGPDASARAFAAAWCARRGVTASVRTELRAFELTRVVPPPPPPGVARRATAADLGFAAAAYRGFYAETHAALGASTPEGAAQRIVANGNLRVWDDGGPVAQAGIVGTTENGARVGAVYTPADRRRRGYATALVAALSQEILASGRRFAFLFTDLANPVSNSIYPKVGYRPLADFADLDFGPGPPGPVRPRSAS